MPYPTLYSYLSDLVDNKQFLPGDDLTQKQQAEAVKTFFANADNFDLSDLTGSISGSTVASIVKFLCSASLENSMEVKIELISDMYDAIKTRVEEMLENIIEHDELSEAEEHRRADNVERARDMRAA